METAEKIDINKRYTYADYCTWNDDERWELIDGVPYAMAAPLISHQRISGRIYYQIHHFLRDKTCEVFHAPTDVRLNSSSLDNTVVQPDLLVVCDKTKIDQKGIIGAPDMVVEILSPSSLSYDMLKKYALYLKSNVREYWIVDPELKTVVAHTLKDGTYTGKAYGETETIPVSVLEGCVIDLAEIFTE